MTCGWTEYISKANSVRLSDWMREYRFLYRAIGRAELSFNMKNIPQEGKGDQKCNLSKLFV